MEIARIALWFVATIVIIPMVGSVFWLAKEMVVSRSIFVMLYGIVIFAVMAAFLGALANLIVKLIRVAYWEKKNSKNWGLGREIE